MKISIHQPNFLPWMGYFYKMAKSDLFVILDSIQYEKNGFTNRVKIKTSRGESWLSLPVFRKFPQIISEVELAEYDPEKILKTIELNYKKAEYFAYFFQDLKSVLSKEWKFLSELNIALIKLMKEKIGIETKLKISSDFKIDGKGDDLLINICKSFQADSYISGQGGNNYQSENKFMSEKINLEYSDFSNPSYLQLWGDFIPGLSVIDLIFNAGPKSKEILLKN